MTTSRKLSQDERETIHTKLDVLGEADCPNCARILNWTEMPVMIRGQNRRLFSVSCSDCGISGRC